MARRTPNLSLGLMLAGLLGASSAFAQSGATGGAQKQNPHNPAKPTQGTAAGAADTAATETSAAARPEDANVHAVENKDRDAEPGKGSDATGAAQRANPHSVKNKDHHGKKHHKAGEETPTAKPADADTK